MEKKRKRIQSADAHRMSSRVAGSGKQKTTPVAEEKDKEMNYLNRPHLQFR